METVTLEMVGTAAYVTMNRPEKRNAFNSRMVAELMDAFDSLKEDSCRCIVLTGEGTAFSAGADLEYMRQIKLAGSGENLADANTLANLLETIYSHPKPVIARVNGVAIGGGVGLIAACDIVIAVKSAFFAFSEVKLGLVPAVISPYVIRKIGEGAMRCAMLTAGRIDAESALGIGLVHYLVEESELDDKTGEIAAKLAKGGPEALAVCKKIIRRVGEEPIDNVKLWTAERIAELRASDEGQEGIAAYLEKRKPRWET